MVCSHINNCELFTQFALNPALGLWKDHYCKGNYRRCTRFQISGKGQPIPLTLLPNGKRVRVLHSREEMGVLAIFNAITKDRAHMVGSLIRAGANPDAKNIEGITPLMAAARQGATDIVKLLIERGASITTRNIDGLTAYDIARHSGQDDIARLLKHCAGKKTLPKAK